MDNQTLTPIFPDLSERRIGWRYLLFQVVFLSGLLGMILSLLNIPVSGVGINLIYFCVNCAVSILAFRRFWLRTLSDAGKSILKILAVSLGSFLAFRVLSTAMGILILLIDPDFANVNDESIQILSQDSFWIMALGTVVLAPIAEEVFNRGCVFGSLYSRSKVAAYTVSAVVFSIIHINGYIGLVPPLTLFLCFLQYLPAGVCLAAAYQLSGSILAPILIHSAVNAIGILTMR